MFETLVTGLLTSALGSYIEPKCFSSDKINVAVWSGYVVLTELEVKPEIVADLPAVKLVRGVVGSLELKIPWNRLQSDSVVATVDDVYLLLRTEEDIDAVMREMDEFTIKKKLLEELYAQAKRQELTEDGTGAPSNEDDCELQRDRHIDFETCSTEEFSKVAFRLEESQYCDMLYLASALQVPDHYTNEDNDGDDDVNDDDDDGNQDIKKDGDQLRAKVCPD
eukprot:jgi/Phyca11/16158/fgenesh1_pg.PHYCAscaffold_18_\